MSDGEALVSRGPVWSLERDEAMAFLRREGYAPDVDPQDRIFTAELNGEIAGVVRLAVEQNVLVLRGMRIRSDVRRQGIGRNLLAFVQQEIGDETCYCIPYSWLLSFYGEIGFKEVAPTNVPSFLADRAEQYRKNGLHVALMRR